MASRASPSLEPLPKKEEKNAASESEIVGKEAPKRLKRERENKSEKASKEGKNGKVNDS